MKIVFVASEMRPFAETGGLGDSVRGLSRALSDAGHEVKVFLPLYGRIKSGFFHLKKVTNLIEVPMGKNREHAKLFHTVYEGVEVYCLDQPFYFDRPELYGDSQGDYEDSDRRFIFFNRGVLESLKKLHCSPQIIHCHDWHTGLIPAYLKTLYKNEPLFKKTRTVFTVHNIAYQGNFPPDSFPITGLPWDEFRLDRLEFWGKLSFMKSGLIYSDTLTTVSEEYAKEIQTEIYGCGMEPVLRMRRDEFKGILNGIDESEWNPETDKEISFRFSAKDPKNKARNKAALQKEQGFKADPKIPLFGFVGRFSVQKGLDILFPLLKELGNLPAQFIFLGTGDAVYEKQFKAFAQSKNRNIAVHLRFDPSFAKRIFAASDIFLMPSLFEPCGISQMIAMRYGAVPLVRATGGLKETVHNFDPTTGRGNGVVFEEFTEKALLDTIKHTIALYHKKAEWTKLQKRCLNQDFSWMGQAKKYVEVYKMLLKKKMLSKKAPSVSPRKESLKKNQ